MLLKCIKSSSRGEEILSDRGEEKVIVKFQKYNSLKINQDHENWRIIENSGVWGHEFEIIIGHDNDLSS